jgi:hypothetical protein
MFTLYNLVEYSGSEKIEPHSRPTGRPKIDNEQYSMDKLRFQHKHEHGFDTRAD